MKGLQAGVYVIKDSVEPTRTVRITEQRNKRWQVALTTSLVTTESVAFKDKRHNTFMRLDEQVELPSPLRLQTVASLVENGFIVPPLALTDTISATQNVIFPQPLGTTETLGFVENILLTAAINTTDSITAAENWRLDAASSPTSTVIFNDAVTFQRNTAATDTLGFITEATISGYIEPLQGVNMADAISMNASIEHDELLAISSTIFLETTTLSTDILTPLEQLSIDGEINNPETLTFYETITYQKALMSSPIENIVFSENMTYNLSVSPDTPLFYVFRHAVPITNVAALSGTTVLWHRTDIGANVLLTHMPNAPYILTNYADSSGSIAVVDKTTGDLLYTYTSGSIGLRRGWVTANGESYVNEMFYGSVVKLDATGSGVWSVSYGNLTSQSPFVVNDNEVIVSVWSADTQIARLDPTNGSVIWTYTASSDVKGAVIDNYAVYVITSGGTLIKVDLDTGQALWSAATTYGSLTANTYTFLIQTPSVVVNVYTMQAYDKTTGQKLWEDGTAANVNNVDRSPPADVSDDGQYVYRIYNNILKKYDATTGILWSQAVSGSEMAYLNGMIAIIDGSELRLYEDTDTGINYIADVVLPFAAEYITRDHPLYPTL